MFPAAFAFACITQIAVAGSDCPATLGVHTDIHLVVENVDGLDTLVTGVRDLSDPGNPQITTPVRLFVSEFGENNIDGFTDDPGFNADSGTFPISNTVIGFNFLDALRKWDPIGGDFDDIPAERFRAIQFPLDIPTGDTPDQFVAGFNFATASSGGLHDHINWFLEAPQPDGVYLVQLEITTNDPLIPRTDPIYILFNNGDPIANDFDGACAYVQQLLEPAACEGDANGDGVVDVNDISYVLFRLGGPAPDGDANADGTVDVNDISFVLFRLGNPC